MQQFDIISVNDDRWNEVVSKSIEFDFYHSSCYNKLENQGNPILLVASIDNDFVAMPLVERSIENSSYKDCTSVYGYAGPISNKKEISLDLKNYFQSCLNEYFTNNNIISVFSRLHPIFDNFEALEGIGEIINLNKTVAIDLSLTLDDERKLFRKSNKYEINKLVKNGFIVQEANNNEIDEFIDIYYKNMKKVRAKKYYYFSTEYFENFLKNNCFETKLLLAKKDNIITAGAIFTITNNIMQFI